MRVSYVSSQTQWRSARRIAMATESACQERVIASQGSTARTAPKVPFTVTLQECLQ